MDKIMLDKTLERWYNVSKELQHKLTAEEIQAIERVLSKGDRAEIVPVKDGKNKILKVSREVVQTKQENSC